METVFKHFNDLSLKELYEILQLRCHVFIVEQTCPYLDIDDKDEDAYHLYFREDGKIIAYLRLLKQGVSYKEASIGRVICIKRREGIGTRLMLEGIKRIKEVYHPLSIRIGAQLYALSFYEGVGFKQVSEPYLEDDIEHIEMLLEF